MNPGQLIADGVIPQYMLLQIHAGDVDVDNLQRDEVYVNPADHPDYVGFLRGEALEWSNSTFGIDISKIKFPNGDLDANGFLIPAENIIFIDVDVFYNDSDPLRTGTVVDWASLGFQHDPWRPVLTLHGWNGSQEAWGPVWRNNLEAKGINTYAIQMEKNGSLSLNALGDGVSIRKTIEEMRRLGGVDRVVVVGHSKGGLDTRRYLQVFDDVDRLIMLGTPNAGSPWANDLQGFELLLRIRFPDMAAVADSEFGKNKFGKQLSEPYMRSFNAYDVPNPGTYYVGLAGDYRSGGLPILPSFLRGSNDLVVPVTSVFSLPYGGASHFIPYLSSTFGATHIGLHSSTDIYDLLEPWVYGEPPEPIDPAFSRPALIASNSNMTITTLGEYPADILEPAFDSVDHIRTSSASERGIPGGEDVQQTKMHVGFIEQGEAITHTLQVDAGSEVIFKLSGLEADLSFELIDPSGNRIDPASAQSLPDVEYEAINQIETLKFKTYQIQNPAVGQWQLEVTGVTLSADSAVYSIGAQIEGASVIMTPGTDASFYQNGDDIVFTASVTYQQTPVLDATVEATVAKPDGSTATIPMSDDGTGDDAAAGDGQYTGSLANPTQSGWYPAIVTAERTSGVAFSRQALTGVSVSASRSAFSGSFSDAGVDDDGDGLYDFLDVQVGVTIDLAGKYAVSARLEDGTQTTILGARVDTVLTSGSHTLTLRFDGRRIYQNGVDGPYYLANLVLTEADDLEPVIADVLDAAYTTSSYTSTSFERPAILPVGTPRETPIDNNGNGFYEQLQIEVDVDFLYTDTYTFFAELVDANGQVIDTDGYGPYQLNAGQYPIPLTFDGELIRSNGVDGPYFVRNLTIQGSFGTSLTIAQVLETQPYSYEDFGTPAPDGCVSAASGSWGSPSTWAGCGGGLPSDSVAIQSGHTVTVGAVAEVGAVTVTQGGTLALSDSLHAANVAVESGAAVTFAAGGVLAVETTLTTVVSLTVTADASLDVAPGGTVRAGEGVLITLQGKTDIRGTAAAPVVFEGDGLAAGERWGGLRLEGDDGFLGYAEVRGADVGVEVRAKDVTLYRLTLSGNGDGVVSDYASGSTLSVSAMSGGSSSKAAALGGERSRFSVRFSTIEDNAGHGLVLRNADVEVLRNTIAGNAGHGVLVWNADAFPFQGNTVTGNGGPSDSTVEDGVAVLSGGDATLYSFGIVYSEGGNTVADNAGHELSVAPGGFLSVGSGAGGHNAVTESAPSSGYRLVYNGTKGATVAAEQTWWGFSSGPPTGALYGSVDFKPFMTSPPGGSSSLARDGLTADEGLFPAEAANGRTAYAPSANDAGSGTGASGTGASEPGVSGSDVRAWLRDRLRTLRRDVGQGAGTDGAPGLLRRLYALQRLDRLDVLGERDATMALLAQLREYLDAPNLPPPFRRLAEASLAAEVAEALRTESYEEAEALLTEYAPGVEGDARLALVLDAVAVDEQAGRYAEALARLDEVILSLPPEEEGLARSLSVVASLIEGRMESGERSVTGGQAVAKGAPEGGPSRAFALGSAYPNPTRTAATVPFEVPETSDVQIGVYDLLGRRVAVLADERFEPGRHVVTFDASRLATGVYLLRATMTGESGAGHVFTQKLTLLQ